MDIKSKDHNLYYYILQCKDICKTDKVALDSLKFIYKAIHEMSKDEIQQLINTASIVMKDKLDKLM